MSWSPERMKQLNDDMALFFAERGFTVEEIREAEKYAYIDLARAARCYASLAADCRRKRQFAVGINERIRESIAKEKRDAA